MLNFDLDRTSTVPIYIQVFENLANKIRNGTIKGGTKLPSQRDMAMRLGVSVNTVVSAYNMLIQYDYITSSNKRGYFVNNTDTQSTIVPERRWHNNKSLKYNFSRNGVDRSMNSEFKKAIRQTAKYMTDRDFLYPDYTGEYELRSQICHMLSGSFGIECTPMQVVMGCGINYLLDALLKVIGPDKVCGFENPAYCKVMDFMRYGNYKKKFINISEDGITGVDLLEFEADILFLMPYSHYPLGYTMSREQKHEVLEWAKKDRYIIEYGMDMEFVYSGYSPSLFSMSEDDNVIFMGDFSKTISPEINLSYLVLPESLVKRWQSKYLWFHSYASRFEQTFVSEIIRSGSYQKNIRRLKKAYEKKRDYLILAIKNHPIGDKIKILNQNAGTYLLIQPKTNADYEELIVKCHEAGVKLSYVKNALEQPNDKISPKTYILGFGALSEQEILGGINLLLDTWADIMKKYDE